MLPAWSVRPGVRAF